MAKKTSIKVRLVPEKKPGNIERKNREKNPARMIFSEKMREKNDHIYIIELKQKVLYLFVCMFSIL